LRCKEDRSFSPQISFQQGDGQAGATEPAKTPHKKLGDYHPVKSYSYSLPPFYGFIAPLGAEKKLGAAARHLSRADLFLFLILPTIHSGDYGYFNPCIRIRNDRRKHGTEAG
jgi:hypothetical protein